MKRLLPYLIVALFLVACGKKVEIIEPPFVFDDNLLQIDSMMQHDADSALQMLLSFRVERGFSSEFNDNYHSLILSEALYKTDNPQLNRYRNETFQETSLHDAMHYFDSLAFRYPDNDDITMLSARSHYMNGVGFYENDSIVEACKEYLKTLEIMEDHFDVENLTGYKAKFMGLTYTRLGEIFSNNLVATPAIDSYKQALNCFLRLKDYSLANTFLHIGMSYLLNKNNDSALYYYRKSMSLAKEQNKMSVYIGSISGIAPLYYDLGYKDTAFMMIHDAFSLPKDDDQYMTCCFTYGEMLAKECQYDSAIHYLEQSINRNTFATKTVSAELLTNCYMALGDTVKANYYQKIYSDNFTIYRNTSETNIELSNIYDDYQQKHLEKTNLLNKKHSIRPYLFVFVSLMLGSACAIIMIKRKAHKTIVNYNIKLENKDKDLAEMKRKIEANPFFNEPICKSILETANKQQFKSKVSCSTYSEFALSKEQLLLLEEAIDRHYDNFTQWIKKEYPALTFDDIDYCCLYYLGLKDTDIFALMQRAYPTIVERSRKLKRIFNSQESLHSTIKSIIEAHCTKAQ
jgi:hypothetical protein